jgi:hypothetical protein
MLTKLSKKVAENFYCELCDYSTCRKFNYDKHISTARHIKLTNVNKKVAESSKKVAETSKNIEEVSMNACFNCNKIYKSRVGLWKHKKNCILDKDECKNNVSSYEPTTPEIIELITQLVKGQNGLQDSILEICKNGTNNTTITNTNSHNKTFNLNMFLNETCKDAMNITEFVDSIKFQLSDLEKVGELGYVKGISNIIVKNLNALDITKRPVHCADKKREVLYVKDDNKWEKENDENEKLRKMIKRVAFKNYKQITQFKAKHPDCNTSESKYSDQYNKIIIESMGGEGDNEKENEDKIIRNISKEVVIDKTTF